MKQPTELDNIPTIEVVDCYEVPDDCLAELQILNAEIPSDMLKYFLRKAMHEFTERSRVQQRRITINLQPCVCEYPMDLAHGEEFIAFQSQSRNPTQQAETTTECGGYQVRWDVPSCTVVVAPAPNCSGPVKLKIATAPSIESCLVDKKIFTRHFRTIMHGAKSYLYAMTGDEVTWTNAPLATFHDAKFTAGITSAGTDRVIGHGAGRFTMRHRRIM